jgi:hypothetical protein
VNLKVGAQLGNQTVCDPERASFVDLEQHHRDTRLNRERPEAGYS